MTNSTYAKHKHKPNQKLISDKSLTSKQLYEQMTKQYYPGLNEYFRQQFSTPQNFFKARSAFIQSTAVMSIIGYIMGLGDRHAENILFDVCSGEIFHVDCNMLFNKGESLQYPERVPFRLTQGIVDAMGVLGIEGPFKKCCEIVLRVMTKEKKTLLSYLRPMVYDPLLKNNNEFKSTDGRHTEAERVESEAIANIKNIENRLKGVASKFKGSSVIPLSTEGHVKFIIEEATNVANLELMFKGWMPWM